MDNIKGKNRGKWKRYVGVLCCCLLAWVAVSAQEKLYHAADWGVKPGLKTMQTEQLQRMIDEVAARGGGIVRLSAGAYITGCIELKSNVWLDLERGAVLLGSTNPDDYRPQRMAGEPVSPNAKDNSALALIVANGARNIGVTGQGVIDGQGLELALNIDSLHHRGVRIDPNYNNRRKRPGETARPKLFRLSHADGVTLRDVTLRNSACWGVTLELCRNVVMDNLTVYNRAYWNNDGLDITDCRNVRITRCDINAADDGICLKSYYPGRANDSIYIADCRICSSASAVKFGTASHGGFRRVTIDNVEVYDTYRSAIAIETVDGGGLEDVRVTRVRARNTGNPLFIRLGHRSGESPGFLRNIYIGQMEVEVPFGRPDEDCDLRGPALNFFHNPIPASITGIPGAAVENVVIEDVTVHYPGRATKGMAYVPLWRLDAVPEEVDGYPEFSMFGELPAWGFYVRHVRGIAFRNVKLQLAADDFRPAFVLDDVEDVTFERLQLPSYKGQIAVRGVKHLQLPEELGVVQGE